MLFRSGMFSAISPRGIFPSNVVCIEASCTVLKYLRRAQVDEALEALQSSKGEGAGVRGGAHSEEAGLALEGLRLRSEMQRAAEEERCAALQQH